MNFIHLRKYLLTVLILIIPALMWGCGGGSTPAAGASVAVASLGGGEYTVQGNNLKSVAAMEFDLGYDISSLSSPTVTQGGFIPGALFEYNIVTPGTIRIVLVSTNAYSGSGQLAKVTFATHTGTPTITVNSVKMYNLSGDPI